MDSSPYFPSALSAPGQPIPCPTGHASPASSPMPVPLFPSSHSASSSMRKVSPQVDTQSSDASTDLSFLLVLASAMGEKSKSCYAHCSDEKVEVRAFPDDGGEI